MTKPLVVSCGEPAGIGPEIAAKAWAELGAVVPFAYIGDPEHLPDGTPFQVIDTLSDVSSCASSALPVLAHPFPGKNTPGIANPINANGVIGVIARAVALAANGDAAGIVTCPIHKKALKDGADFAYPGHTEYLAHLGNVPRVVMMLASDTLRVVPTTIHIALDAVKKTLTPELLAETIRITAGGLQRDFGLATPRMAVAGLNPHAGEGGAMGHEEIDVIAPVVQQMQGEGYDITGPYSADTMFHAAARARYDVAICMYHDQALIPIKTLDFDRGVNVTLGLPFLRTSPDHGTAFDIAGRGIANPTSMIEALKMAHRAAHRI